MRNTLNVGFLLVTALGGARLSAQNPKVAVQPSPDASVEEVLARPITIRLRHISLVQAVDSLSRVAKVVVEYQLPRLEAYPSTVSIDVKHMPLGVALEQLLSGTALRIVAGSRGSLVIVPVVDGGSDSLQKTGVVSGRVVDSATGRGLSATIKVVGTKLTVIANDSGRFTVKNVPVGDQSLMIRLFGYRPAEHKITVAEGSNVSVRVALHATPNVLSGVLTTATGVQDRRTVGNDITVINADSVLRVAPVTTVTDLLATRVPGLTVQHTSGIPGAPSRIRLRGVGGGLVAGAENTSNDPIVIVDGVRIYARQSTMRDQNLAPVRSIIRGTFGATTTAVGIGSDFPTPSALDQIDVNSIETIEIFKGPSATSQWGSDAGNGVIVITTKRGRAGPTQLSGSVSTGIATMPGQYAAPGYYVFGRQVYFEGFPSSLCTSLPTSDCVSIDSVVRFQAANNSRSSPFGTGTRTEGSAQVAGGSGTLTYSVTGSASNALGYLKMPEQYRDFYRETYHAEPPAWMKRPTAYKTWGVSTIVGFVPTPGLQVMLGGSFTNSNQRQGSGESALAALSSMYIDTTNLGFIPATGGRVIDSYVRKGTSHDVTNRGNITAKWIRWRMLPIDITGGVETKERTDKQLIPFGLHSSFEPDTLGSFSVGHGRSVTTTGNVASTVPITGILKAAVGGNISRTSTEDFAGFKDTLAQGVSEPSTISGGTQHSSSLTTAGWFIEPQFKSHTGLSITPGLRLDGGSGSAGTSHSMSLFPKLGVSWLAIDREGSAPIGGVLTMLRTRLGFGIAGVQPEPAWRKRLMSEPVDPATGRPVSIGGVTLSTLGNPTIHPERAREVEGGFETTLWNGRANLNVTGYHKLRTDAIQQIQTAPSVYGGQTFYLNIGRVLNTGTDVSVDARVLETGLIAWGVNATVSAYRNKLVTLYGDAPYVDVGDGTRLVQGYSVDGRWSRPILGYNDTNGDGKISIDEVSIADQAVYVGDAQPSIQIPFGTTLSLWHGRLGITAQFDYKGGVTQFNDGGAELLQNLYADTGAKLGQQATAIAAYCALRGTSCGGELGTDYGIVQTVSSLRFNTFSVNYAVPPSFSAHFGIPRMSVALQGSNLRLWTNYRGKDPDVNANVVGESIIDTGIAPLPRSWTLRFDLGN